MLSRSPAWCATPTSGPPARSAIDGFGGEIDNILLKALQKDPARRYSSVVELSEDIRRYLEGLPITARPDTAAYRAMKFLRRHRLGVAGRRCRSSRR